jgi:hypothetical protein
MRVGRRDKALASVLVSRTVDTEINRIRAMQPVEDSPGHRLAGVIAQSVLDDGGKDA